MRSVKKIFENFDIRSKISRLLKSGDGKKWKKKPVKLRENSRKRRVK